MKIVVLYFAGLRDLVSRAEEEIEAPSGASVAQMLQSLKLLHPQLQLEGVRCAVNEEFVSLDWVAEAGDVLALIPPVSGG